MATAFICQACTDAKPNSELVLTAGQPLCSECFVRGVKPDFIAALESETNHPVKYNSTILDINDFADLFTREFLFAYNIKLQEYGVPIHDRLYCDNIVSDRSASDRSAQQTCAQFLGNKALLKEVAVLCPGCSSHVCTKCTRSFSGRIDNHICIGTLEVDAFEGLERGVDYQICPGCQTKVQLSAACNHMTCQMCPAEFCYICGMVAEEGHWTIGKPCPRYGQVGSHMFDPLPEIVVDARQIDRWNAVLVREATERIGRAGLTELGLNEAPRDAYENGETFHARERQRVILGARIRASPIHALMQLHDQNSGNLVDVILRLQDGPQTESRQSLLQFARLLEAQLDTGIYFEHLRRDGEFPLPDVEIHARLEALFPQIGQDALAAFPAVQHIFERYNEAGSGNGEAIMHRAVQAEALQEMMDLQEEHNNLLNDFLPWYPGVVYNPDWHSHRELARQLLRLTWMYSSRLRTDQEPVSPETQRRDYERVIHLTTLITPFQWTHNRSRLREIVDTFVNAYMGRFDDRGRVIRGERQNYD